MKRQSFVKSTIFVCLFVQMSILANQVKADISYTFLNGTIGSGFFVNPLNFDTPVPLQVSFDIECDAVDADARTEVARLTPSNLEVLIDGESVTVLPGNQFVIFLDDEFDLQDRVSLFFTRVERDGLTASFSLSGNFDDGLFEFSNLLESPPNFGSATASSLATEEGSETTTTFNSGNVLISSAVPASTVPEPTNISLLGLLGLGLVVKRRR